MNAILNIVLSCYVKVEGIDNFASKLFESLRIIKGGNYSSTRALGYSNLLWKSGLIREVAPLEGTSLLAFYNFSASEI